MAKIYSSGFEMKTINNNKWKKLALTFVVTLLVTGFALFINYFFYCSVLRTEALFC